MLFLAEHYYTKKDDGQIVHNIDLLNIQDGDGFISLSILYYSKGMPAYLLTYLST